MNLIYKEKEKIGGGVSHREMWRSGTVTVESSWWAGEKEKRHEVRDGAHFVVIWSPKTPRQVLAEVTR